jgi:hypothetical protein
MELCDDAIEIQYDNSKIEDVLKQILTEFDWEGI